MTEPKIQWSKFSPDRSEQYVIRVETYEELKELREFVLKDIPKTKSFPDDEGDIATPPSQVQEKAKMCPIHNKVLSPSKFDGGFYCATKDKVTGKWCSTKVS